MAFTAQQVWHGILGVTLATNGRTRRRAARAPNGRLIFLMAHSLDAALMGFLASGFFVTVLYYPFFWINLSMTVALNQVARHELAALPAPAAIRRRSAAGLARLPRRA